MSVSMLYLIKSSISLAVIWLFYQLMLRRLTFYNLNRWYLLGYALLSFVIPLIDIGPFLAKDAFQGAVMIRYIPVIGTGQVGAGQKGMPFSGAGLFARMGLGDVLPAIMLSGSVILLIRLLCRWYALRRVRRRARLISDDGVMIFQVDQPMLPFSFGNAIYINRQQHTEKEYAAIILHEYVHIRQKHTIDILLSELVCIAGWYNPFAWLIRYSIRQNLEFIADRKVLENGLDRKGYQYHLLQVVGVSSYRLANNFNFSSLKKRIIMMNKIKSARMHLVKFLFVVPLVAVLLLAFRGKINSARMEVSVVSGKMTGSKLLPLVAGERPFSSLKMVSRTDTVPKKTETAKPLYILDGVKMRNGWQLDSIDANKIQYVEVLGKGEMMVRKYGAAAVNGVVLITTKDSTRLPLYIIDGVEIPAQNIKELPSSDIESINVLRGDSVTRKYGEKGRNGVILIQTKEKVKVKDQPVMIIEPKNEERIYVQADSIVMGSKKDSVNYVYFVNGVKAKAGVPENLLVDQRDLLMVECTEKEDVLKKYGLQPDQKILNLVTKTNRDNQAAYILYKLN